MHVHLPKNIVTTCISTGKLSANTVKGTRNAAVLETGFCRIGKGFSHAEEKLVLVLLCILYTDVENGDTYAHGLLTCKSSLHRRKREEKLSKGHILFLSDYLWKVNWE